ncbi:MAG TPA: HNH endonuclease [Pyrinomonadaceae bacterium]|jgi:hypothetical protein
MGTELKSGGTEVQEAESVLAGLNSDLEFQLAQTAVDVAGVADPTPISDIVGASMSLYSGDIVGAGLSLLSVLPYAGDALGKTAKGARVADKINDLKKRIEAAIAATNLAKKLARRRAAAAVRAKRKAEAARKTAEAATNAKCKPPSNPFGVRQLPADGTWKGTKGNGDWMPDPKTPRGKEILEATDGKPITFKDGYPDFSSHATHRAEIEMTGDPYTDFKLANKEVGLKETPAGMTWHHHQDGVTMELIPTKINNNVPHDGGASVVKSPDF